MKVYINEIVLCFQKVTTKNYKEYDLVLKNLRGVELSSLKNNVLIDQFSIIDITLLLNFIQESPPKKLLSITFSTQEKNAVKKFFKERYNYIKAAGGLVTKGDKVLFIYRMKKWDLPKGKLEKGEEIEECAVREVEEECSIKVKALEKIGSTWHCYSTSKNGWCVKRTVWYLMECIDDSNMQPQQQEDIEEIAWVSPDNITKYLANSFGTINVVFEKARKKKMLNL